MKLSHSNPVLHLIASVVSLKHPMVLGDEVPSVGFSRLRSSWGLSGAGLLAVLRLQAKAGGAGGDQEKMLEWRSGTG